MEMISLSRVVQKRSVWIPNPIFKCKSPWEPNPFEPRLPCTFNQAVASHVCDFNLEEWRREGCPRREGHAQMIANSRVPFWYPAPAPQASPREDENFPVSLLAFLEELQRILRRHRSICCGAHRAGSTCHRSHRSGPRRTPSFKKRTKYRGAYQQTPPPPPQIVPCGYRTKEMLGVGKSG